MQLNISPSLKVEDELTNLMLLEVEDCLPEPRNNVDILGELCELEIREIAGCELKESNLVESISIIARAYRMTYEEVFEELHRFIIGQQNMVLFLTFLNIDGLQIPVGCLIADRVNPNFWEVVLDN